MNRLQKTKLETKKYYDNRCCITGFELGYDHAHISPGGWKENDTLSNSFLMDKTPHSLYYNKVGFQTSICIESKYCSARKS